MAKRSLDLDLFTGEPVKPETRKEKREKQRTLLLRSEGIPGLTMVTLWRSSIKSKRTHWTAGSTHVACGVPKGIAEHTILVELVNCEACQRKAKEAWEALVGHMGGYDVEEEE